MKENEKKFINLYAGRPGAGKTHWAIKEIEARLEDPHAVVFYVCNPKSSQEIAQRMRGLPGKLFLTSDEHAGQAIGCAIDVANQDDTRFAEDDESLTAQNERIQVSVFYDQCRHFMFHGYRDILVAAAKAGVSVNILCQVFRQVDKGDLSWLTENCICSIISKGRAPRVASKEEIEKLYR